MGDCMTTLLAQAVQAAEQLPEHEQDALAQWILAELEDEVRWSHAFAASPDALARLADEALADLRSGATQSLDPNAL
jgi:hypothetical protein